MKLQQRVVGLYRRAAGLAKTGVHRSLPDVSLTPGDVLTVSERRILAPGWSALARCVPDSQKRRVLLSYGISWEDRDRFLVDHLVPCCLGGSNLDSNLWPHSHSAEHSPGKKYRLEQRLLSLIRRKSLPLAEAQAWLCLDWTEAFREFCDGGRGVTFSEEAA